MDNNKYDSLYNLMGVDPSVEKSDVPTVSAEPIIPPEHAASIERAVGLNISQPAQPKVNDVDKENSKVIKKLSELTPEELEQMKNAGKIVEEKINYQKENFAASMRKADEASGAKFNQMAATLQNAIKQEEARVERHEKALEDEEVRERVFGDEDDKKGKVVEDFEKPKTNIFAEDVIDEDELVPAYDDPETEDEDDDSTEVVSEQGELVKQHRRPNPNDSEEQYREYFKELETVDLPSLEHRPITVVKDRATVVTVSTKNKMKPLGDQAFLNSVTKFKKDNFRTVTIPLVNSGFSVSIVGTGAVDLALLYSQVDDNTTAIDYEMEKMRTVIRNVVATQPMIDRNELRNMIHFADYQLMAYAHIAATLSQVSMLQQCVDCGNDFHVNANSADLILNMDEMYERMNEINHSDTIKHSLMTENRELRTKNGFVVTLGHPSYNDYIVYLAELKNLSTKLTPIQMHRIQQMTASLPYVRNVVLPNKVYTSNLYQRFIAITMLDDNDYNDMENQIKQMRDQIITPQFGIKKVICPHCHKVNTNIPYKDLSELLFFHFMVSRMMSSIDD